MLGPLPRRSHGVRIPVSSSVSSAFPQRGLGRLPASLREYDFSRGVFSRLQTFLYVQASEFARLPGRSYRCATCRRAAETFTSGQNVLRLPRHAPDMLAVRIQAIDGTRTFTLLDSQLCRPLPSPPPHTARPGSRELPVDPYRDHRWGFPCCVWSPMRTCRRHYPGRFDEACSLVGLHRLRPSL